MPDKEHTTPTSPAVLRAELRLLNAVYKNPDFIISESLHEDLFPAYSAKTIYNAIFSLVHDEVPLSPNALIERVHSIDGDISVGIIQSIIDLEDEAPSTIKDIKNDLYYEYNKTLALENLDKIKTKIKSKFRLLPEEENSLRNDFYEAEKLLFTKNRDIPVKNMEQWFDQYIPEFDKRRLGKRWKFHDIMLDSLITEGPSPGTIGLLVAATGMGKSSFLLNMINRFINQETPIMDFSLEMGSVSTMDKLLAMRLNIPTNSIINPSSPEDFDSLKQLIENERQILIENKLFRFCENPTLYIKDIRSRIAKFQADIGQTYCIVAIDLITMIQDFTKIKNGVNSAFQMEVAINEMSALAKEMDVHIIGVAQLNRTIESDKIHDIEDIEKFRPTRNSIKNSAALLERTRYCLSLFRPKYYAMTYLGENYRDEIELMADEVSISLLKQNMGEVGGYKMLFAPEVCKMIHLKESVDDLVEQAMTENKEINPDERGA